MAHSVLTGGDVEVDVSRFDASVRIPYLRDICVTLRSALSTCIDLEMTTTPATLVERCILTILRKIDYHTLGSTEVTIRNKERLLMRHLLNFSVVSDNLNYIKILLVMIYENERASRFDFPLVEMIPGYYTFYFIDFNANQIVLTKDFSSAIPEYKFNLSFRDFMIILNSSTHHPKIDLLKLCGDVESNPGPTSIEELERQLRVLQIRMKRFDNKAWRDNDRKKTEKKNKRREAQGLFSFCHNTGEAMHVMANGMGPVLDSIKTAMDSIAKTGEEMKSVFKIPKDVDIIGSLLSLVQLVDSILKKNLFSCSIICAQMARQCGVSFGSLMSLIPRKNNDKIEFEEEGKEPLRVGESLFNNPKELEDKFPIIAIGTTVVGFLALFCKGICPSLKDMAVHFGAIGRAAQGFRAIRDFFGWLWEYAMGVYCQSFYGISYEEYKMTKEFPELGRICGGIKLAETISREMISNSLDVCKQIISMKAQLEDYLLEAAKIRSKNLVFITKLRDRLKEKYDMAMTSPAIANAIRDEPVCVYLYGQPGVGKSVMTTVLTADYYKDFLAERGVNYNSVSHSRKAINEHWDGYCNQPILVMDDFGNKKDNVMNPCTEFEELQYMINTSEYPLWMADLAKKGTTYFTSELVLLSSNVKYPEIVHMVDPSSIFRRMHIWAEVVCKPEYGTPTGKDKDGNIFYQYSREKAAIAKGVPIDKLDALMTDQYMIKLYHISVDKQSGTVQYQDLNTVLSYDEFYDYFKKVKTERSANNRALSDAIRKRAGLGDVENKQNEKDILDQFRGIFHPEEFIDECSVEMAKCPAEGKMEKCSCGKNKCKHPSVPRKCECLIQKCQCKDDCVCIKDPHAPILTDEERKKFDIQFGDISEIDFCDAEDLDLELMDITLPSVTQGAWKIKLTGLYEYTKEKFMRTVNKIYTSVASGLKHTYGKMIGVAGAFLSYLGSALQKGITLIPFKIDLNVALVTMLGFWVGYLGTKFFLDIPAACEFSLTLNEIYSPCRRCDVCKVMQYSDEGGCLDHFLRRVGVPQVRAALMRCQIWTDQYLSKILQKSEEKCRVAERIYSAQPAIPKPTQYAQALFTYCAIPKVVNHVSKVGMNFTEAMRLIGSLCWYNCDFCLTHHRKYNPMDNNEIIQFGTDIYNSYLEQGCRTILPLPLMQGDMRRAQGDTVRVEQCTNILTKNSVWLQAVTKDGSSSKSTGTFIVGRTLVTTAHSVMNNDLKFETLKIQNPLSKETNDIPLKDCKISRVHQEDGKPTDLAIITLPNVVPSRPKIISKFIQAKELDLLQEGDIVLSGYRLQKDCLVLNEQQTKRFSISAKPASYYEHSDATCPKGEVCRCLIYIGNHIDYEIDTYAGCCGSLISAKNTNIASKIIGFHVAGMTGEPALGVLVSRELLECALSDHIKEHKLPAGYMIDGRFPYSES